MTRGQDGSLGLGHALGDFLVERKSIKPEATEGL